MENSSIHQGNGNPLFSKSPSTQISNNGSIQPITKSDQNNPYPTTFVQADTSTFKQVVQLLTGTVQKGSDPNPTRTHPIPPMKPKQSFKLYERRNSFKNFKINPLLPSLSSSSGFKISPRKHEILSPSILDFPSLALSPVSPLIPDPFTRSLLLKDAEFDSRAEDRAIAEKGFYLHKSPPTTPRDSEPKLLPLFPTTSPRIDDSMHMDNNNLNLEIEVSGDARVRRPRLLEKCPRCNSTDTKFCYYNNYSLNQPRHYCKTCRRYWTQGGICRNIPIGGGSGSSNRRNRRAHPRVTTEPNVSTFSRSHRRRGRSTNADSVSVSVGEGHGRIIPSTCVNFPNELKTGVSEFGLAMSSLGSTPVQSFNNNNNNVVTVKNNNFVVAPMFETFPPPAALMNPRDAWHQESSSLMMSTQQNDNMFFWRFDGTSGNGGEHQSLLPFDINIITDQSTFQDLPEYDTHSPSQPPPHPCA